MSQGGFVGHPFYFTCNRSLNKVSQKTIGRTTLRCTATRVVKITLSKQPGSTLPICRRVGEHGVAGPPAVASAAAYAAAVAVASLLPLCGPPCRDRSVWPATAKPPVTRRSRTRSWQCIWRAGRRSRIIVVGPLRLRCAATRDDESQETNAPATNRRQ